MMLCLVLRRREIRPVLQSVGSISFWSQLLLLLSVRTLPMILTAVSRMLCVVQ